MRRLLDEREPADDEQPAARARVAKLVVRGERRLAARLVGVDDAARLLARWPDQLRPAPPHTPRAPCGGVSGARCAAITEVCGRCGPWRWRRPLDLGRRRCGGEGHRGALDGLAVQADVHEVRARLHRVRPHLVLGLRAVGGRAAGAHARARCGGVSGARRARGRHTGGSVCPLWREAASAREAGSACEAASALRTSSATSSRPAAARRARPSTRRACTTPR